MANWKDISTAPKDGTEFQAWGNRGEYTDWFTRVRFNPELGIFQEYCMWDYESREEFGPFNKYDGGKYFTLTHWDHIPIGPNGEKNQYESKQEITE